MFATVLSALLAAPAICPVPESMPALSEAMAGEGDADWCLDGADPFAIAGPDGTPRQLVWRDETGRVSITQWRRGGPDAMPEDWERVATRRPKAVQQGPFHEVLIQKLGDNVIVVTVNPAWRIGNAVCAGEGGASAAYLPAGIDPTAADRGVIDGLFGFDDIDPGNVMCTLLHPDGDGWRPRLRGPQGRPLPEIDDYYAGTEIRVTPRGDYARNLGLSR
ncbi:hypothetical protein OF829_00770 [Sphingomonas sp. LB-2]|uniref:hypothetical protein n=1 Tax=Sphingomonas caeni TaxID=2984949 RepID=UPI00222EBD5C|nr:hypothetical protein [Sphingomonas caeni]MCW3845753.1 hypothetical protein [Sphingomonas caeni]